MLKGGIIYFVGKFGAALITLLTVAIYTRLLPPAEYGVYTLILSGAMMAYSGLMQWLTFALGRFLPAYRDREALLLSHVAVGYAVVAAAFLVLAMALLPWLAPDDRWHRMMILGVGFFLAVSFAELNLMVFQMRLDPPTYVRYALVRVVVAAAIGVALAYQGWGATGLLLGLIVGNLAIVLPNLVRIWGRVRPGLLRNELLAELAAYGFPFAMTGALASVISVSDRYVIAALMGADDAGLYAAPYDLAMRSLHVLMMVVAMGCNPVIYRTFETDGPAAAAPLIRRQVELLMGIALPGAIAFVMLSPAITHVLLGAPFQAAARELIPWIIGATVLQGFQAFYLALSFALTKQPIRQTAVLATGATLNLGLNFVLIPPLGLTGAALATVLSYGVIVIGSFALGRRLLALPFPPAGLAKILGACAVMAVILWPVSDSTTLAPVAMHAMVAGALYLVLFCGLDIGATRAAAAHVLQLATARIRARGISFARR